MSRTIVEVALDDPDLSVDSSTWDWTDWTTAVERDQVGVSVFRGYRDGSDQLSPTEIRFRGKNGDLRWSIHHANNPYLGRIRKGTPVRVSRNYGAAVVRAVGFIEETSLVSAGAGAYKAADVVCYGASFRADSAPGTESVLYGQIVGNESLISYVPGEDADGATSLRNTVAGQPDAFIVGVTAASDGDVLGSKPLWRISEPTGACILAVPAYAQPYPQQWSVTLVVKIPSEPAGQVLFYSTNCDADGTIRRWLMQLQPGSPAQLQLTARDTAGADALAGAGTTAFTDADGVEPWGRTVGITMSAIQNGADIDWSILLYCTHDASNSGTGASGTLAGHTLGRVTQRSTWPTPDIEGWTLGHWATFNSINPVLGVYFNAYTGADLFTQFFRTAVDAGLLLDIAGTTTSSTSGPLTPGRAVDKLRTVAASESGLMIERASGGLTLLTREDLTNQTVALTINRTDRQVLDLDALEDSFQSANQVLAINGNGDSASADAPYPFDPTTTGQVRSVSLSTNLEDSAQVLSAAQMRVSELSYQDYRYRIELELDGPAAGLRAAFLSSVDIGSRIQITGNLAVSDASTVDTIDQQVMGIEETHTEQGFRVKLNTRPAGPWQMFEVESATGNEGRADTRGAWTLVAVDDNDTSVLVGSYDDRERIGAKFSTTAEPYDLALRAVDRVTCTNVANQTCAFVAAGAASHIDNAAVTPAHPAGIALGDLELLLCSVRDSSGFAYLSGVADRRALLVGDQLGWKPLIRFGGENQCFALYGRTYVGTAAPTLAPQGSVAGDTVSAQTAAFRYAQPVIHRTGIPQQNASAANIAYPALSGLVRSATLVLLVVQKNDDLTSTTAPAGFTKIADASSTAGADQAIAWYYQIQTTPADVAAGSVTVVGGAANTSKAAMISLVTDVQTLTLTRGVNGAVTSHPALADVRLWRAGRLTR